MERQIRVHRNNRRASDWLDGLVRMVSFVVRYAVDPRLLSSGCRRSQSHLAEIMSYRAVRGNHAVGETVNPFTPRLWNIFAVAQIEAVRGNGRSNLGLWGFFGGMH